MTTFQETTQPRWLQNPESGLVPASFQYVVDNLLLPAGCEVRDAVRESESSEYGAIKFLLNGKTVLFRQAKTTPKKIGQFVTIWKRETPQSEVAPFDRFDGVDWVIVAVDQDDQFGVFVFSATLLAQKKVFSEHADGGKRAIRVYAPWTHPVAAQAKRTQKWQIQKFIDFGAIDKAVGNVKTMLAE
jgi:hypothetical protein